MGMEWYEAAFMMIGAVLVLMGLSIPVAFAFLLINIAGAYIFMGGWRGVVQLVANSGDAVASFVLVTVPLFILMGTLFFHSGLALKIIEAVDKCLAKAPGRLSYIAIITSTIFAALSGSNIANTAMMGHLLLPEMEKRNYKPMMSVGPIMGAGGLALLIPPSTLGVLLGSIAQLDIAALLLAGLLPGLVLGALYMCVVKIQSMTWPEAAPAYDVETVALGQKLKLFAIYVMPMSLVVFCVVGFILLGIATPTESAAFGVLSVLVLAACYRCMSVAMLKKSLISTLHVSVMVFFIILTSKNFSQILAFSGATRGLIEAVTMLDFGTYGTLALLFAVLLVLGMFVDGIAMMLLTIPVFFPIITQLGFDPIWFALIMLLAIEMSGTTPPMGLILFVMQGVAPKGTRFWTIVKAGFPYLAADAVLLLLLILMPGLALWLPSLMR